MLLCILIGLFYIVLRHRGDAYGTAVEKKPERHEKRAADTTRGAKGTQGARHPQAKKQYYAEE